jgi:hypothetical protein
VNGLSALAQMAIFMFGPMAQSSKDKMLIQNKLYYAFILHLALKYLFQEQLMEESSYGILDPV